MREKPLRVFSLTYWSNLGFGIGSKTFHVPGVYHVRVTATDQAGNTATRVLPVTVGGVCTPPPKGKHYPSANTPPASDRPPTVKITSPAEGAAFVDPQAIRITAEAADSDGSVARVDFYKEGSTSSENAWRVWLGQATKAPYSVTWRYDPSLEYGPAGGSFILTARAADDQGAVAEHSATITISHGK